MSKVVWVLAGGYGCLFIWLFLFKLSYKSMHIKNKITLFMSSVFGLPASYSYSIFATLLYCLLPILSSLAVSRLGGVYIPGLFAAPLSLALITMTVLGVAACMSLLAVFVLITQKIRPNIQIAAEMANIKWIQGVFQAPAKIAWLLPLLSASFEEIFFRGVFFSALMLSGADPLHALGAVTFAFILNQTLLADTITQRVIMVFSSIAISVVGGVLFLASGSIIPSIIMHASFAGFYTSGSGF